MEMRILQIGLSKNIGGIETFVMRYFRKMVNMGICFDFVDIYGEGIAFENEIKALGGKIYTSPNFKRHPFKAKKYIYQVIKNNNYKFVHINMLSAANLIPLYAAKKAKVVSIVHSHNTSTQGIKKILHKINKYKVLKIADIRLSCGREAGEWFYGKHNFEIIPNAIEANDFTFNENNRQNIREKMGLSEEDFVIGFVGRLSYQKNPLYLVDIMKALRARNNVKLLIVGDGDLRIKLEEYAKEAGVFNNIIFAGLQSEISSWYSAMDCFVLPSFFEGFCIVGVEAQANGLKCFMSENVPHEINITGNVEFLPLEHNALNWGERICTLIGGGNIDVHSRKTNKIAGSLYDISVGVKQLYNVYQEAQSIKRYK